MKLEALLNQKKMTAEELSQKTGIDCFVLSEYMKDKRSLTLEEFEKVAKVLDVDWWKLMEK